jgi:hypothetical protein
MDLFLLAQLDISTSTGAQTLASRAGNPRFNFGQLTLFFARNKKP